MPGRHINDQQVRLYMTARIIRPQATAAAMAGISVATGRRLERDPRPARPPRHHPRDEHRQLSQENRRSTGRSTQPARLTFSRPQP